MSTTLNGWQTKISAAFGVMRVVFGVVLVSVCFMLTSCGGPPQALNQPQPPTLDAASSEIVSLLTFSATGTADPVVGAKWLTWREQVHKPELAWVHRRIRIDWPVEIAFRSAGRMGWRVTVTLARSEGIDASLTAGEDAANPARTAQGNPVETVTRAEFILPTATEAGRLRAAWLRLAGGPAVPGLE